MTYAAGSEDLTVRYRFDRSTLHATVHDWQPEVHLLSATSELVDAEIEGVRRRYRITRCGNIHYVDSALGATARSCTSATGRPRWVKATSRPCVRGSRA